MSRRFRWTLPCVALGMSALTRPTPAHAQAGPDPWRPQTTPLFGLSYSPDIGLVIGAGIAHTRYGFRALPPSAHLRAEAAYATGVSTYRADLAAELRRPGPPTVYTIELHASALALTRFYGLGNESDGARPDSVYRVRQDQVVLALAASVPLAPRLRLTGGPLIKYSHTRNDPWTVLATVGPTYGAGNFGQLGLRVLLDLDTRDHAVAPARGVRVTVAGQLYPPVWNVTDPFHRLSAEASTYLSTGDPAAATLALRAGGTTVGGEVPFQELVYVGGDATVRGYAQQRFAGRRGAYANAELRLLAGRLSVGDVGVFALADAGRVWSPGASSDRWHAAAGGGLWFAWQHRRSSTLSLALARSPERTGAYLRAGFMF